MPLHKGKSEKAFKENVREEMHAGKPQKQSLAIAYSMKRKAQKKAKGGDIKRDSKREAFEKEQKYKSGPEKGVNTISNEANRYSAANAYSEAKKGTNYPADVRERVAERNKQFMKRGHERVLAESRGMPNPKLKGLAEGGSPGPYLPGAASAQASMRSAFGGHAKGGTIGCPQCGYADGGPVKPTPTPTPEPPDYMAKANAFIHRAEGGECPACGYADGGETLKPRPDPSPTPNPAMQDVAGSFRSRVGMNQTVGKSHGGEINRPGSLLDEEEIMGEMKREDKAPMLYDVIPTQYNQGHVAENGEEDMVDRIMHKRSQDFSGEARLAEGGYLEGDHMYPHSKNGHFDVTNKFSEGGKVANSDEIEAGFSPNEFDDLHLRDDLSSTYGDDDNAGDEIGDDREDEDRKDIVARIMASRRKKDRLPSPA
jgi:hypothetical protein